MYVFFDFVSEFDFIDDDVDLLSISMSLGTTLRWIGKNCRPHMLTSRKLKLVRSIHSTIRISLVTTKATRSAPR